MSNPRKPPSLKAIAGTGRKDRDAKIAPVEFPLVSEVPAPPDWLPNAHAVKEWNRLAPILVANRLLTEAGLSALGQLCALHGKVVQLYAAGESPNGATVAQLIRMNNDFGLTPVSQGKVSPSSAEGKENPFAKLSKGA